VPICVDRMPCHAIGTHSTSPVIPYFFLAGRPTRIKCRLSWRPQIEKIIGKIQYISHVPERHCKMGPGLLKLLLSHGLCVLWLCTQDIIPLLPNVSKRRLNRFVPLLHQTSSNRRGCLAGLSRLRWWRTGCCPHPTPCCIHRKRVDVFCQHCSVEWLAIADSVNRYHKTKTTVRETPLYCLLYLPCVRFCCFQPCIRGRRRKAKYLAAQDGVTSQYRSLVCHRDRKFKGFLVVLAVLWPGPVCAPSEGHTQNNHQVVLCRQFF
jgi:hypothetical protein